MVRLGKSYLIFRVPNKRGVEKMTIIQLKYFLTVCELGRIRVAAEQLHVSEPTISVAIRRLEEDIGQPLFTRNRRQLDLTEAGTRFCERAREVVDCFERLESDVEVSRTGNHILRIAAPSTLGEFLYIRYIPAFSEKYPTALFETPPMTSTDAAQQVLDERVELAFCDRLAVTSPMLEFLPLVHTSMHCYVRRDNPLAAQPAATPELLRNEKIILWSEKALISRELLRWFASADVKANLFMYSNRRSVSIDMVRRHDAAAFCLEFAGAPDAIPMPDDLALVPLQPKLMFQLGLVRKKNAVLSRDAQRFFDFCRRNSQEANW